MNEEIERLELIEKYIKGELAGTKLAEFEARLKSDPELSDEVDIFRDILAGTALAGREELAEEISATHQNLKKDGFFENITQQEAKQIDIRRNDQSNIRRIGMSKWWALAAGMALIIVAGYFIFKTGGQPNYEEVFAQIYEPENSAIDNILDDLSSLGMAGADDPRADSLAAALKLYKLDEFDEAQSYLEVLVQNDTEDYIARLYLGLSQLQQGKYVEASQQLKTTSQVNGFRYKDVSDWYLALSYIGFNSKEGWALAKDQLKIIADNPNSAYQQEAKDALEML